MKFGPNACRPRILVMRYPCLGQQKRKIIIDQDAAGPGRQPTSSRSCCCPVARRPRSWASLSSPATPGSTKGAHTLRMLELVGRTDIPVVGGAEYPLVRTQERN